MKYNQNWTIVNNANSSDFQATFLENLNEAFVNLEYKTNRNSRSIEFKKRLRRTTNYGKNMRLAMNTLRSGKVEIVANHNHIMIVRTTINLTYLTIMSLLFGIALTIIGWIIELSAIGIGIMLIFTATMVFFFGLNRANDKIGRILNKIKKHSLTSLQPDQASQSDPKQAE
ncbi:hypothetical protein H8D57_00665 [bacterium]|nr:hypothetical protein [bacterium]